MLLTGRRERKLAKGETCMSAQENMTLARRFIAARVKADLDALEEMMTPDYVSHAKLLPDQQPDREGEKWVVAQFAAAFSKRRLLIEDQVSGADKMVTRFIVHITHDLGEIMGVAPSGREMTNRAIVIHRIVEGKIAEEWGLGTLGSKLRGQSLEQERIEREPVEQELKVARSIQHASLPKEVPQLEGWQISPFYKPAREVGGDFYDFHLLSEGRLGVVVGDATGKGIPAALVMASTRSMLRALARASDYSPGEVLEQVNDLLVTDIPPYMFVTCFYCILDPKSASLTYANAAHDLPYLLRGSGGECEELRARGMPLGLMPQMSYEEKEIVLQEGDSALFYTDGLVEAHDPQR